MSYFLENVLFYVPVYEPAYKIFPSRSPPNFIDKFIQGKIGIRIRTVPPTLESLEPFEPQRMPKPKARISAGWVQFTAYRVRIATY